MRYTADNALHWRARISIILRSIKIRGFIFKLTSSFNDNHVHSAKRRNSSTCALTSNRSAPNAPRQLPVQTTHSATTESSDPSQRLFPLLCDFTAVNTWTAVSVLRRFSCLNKMSFVVGALFTASDSCVEAVSRALKLESFLHNEGRRKEQPPFAVSSEHRKMKAPHRSASRPAVPAIGDRLQFHGAQTN